VLDVGANVGNHALYFATRMAAAKVVVIEPNPLALAPLLANVVVNGLTDVIETRHLGVGLAEVAGAALG
jgi:FkbM family methyltransferase